MGLRCSACLAFIAMFLSGDSTTGLICEPQNADSVRFATECLAAAQKIYDASSLEFFAGQETAWPLYLWSTRWMDADRYLNTRTSDRVAAAIDHLKRMKSLEKMIMPTVAARRRGLGAYLVWNFFVADAEAL